MNIAEKIRHIRKDIRLVKLSLGQVENIVKEYLRQIGWFIHKESKEENKFSITTHSPEFSHSRFFLTRKPQIVNLCAVQEDSHLSRIEIEFGLFRRFKISFYAVLIALLSLILLSIFVLSGKGTDNTPPIIYLLSFFSLMVSSIGMFLFIQRFTDLKAYDGLKKELYGKMADLTGQKEEILFDGLNFPILINALLLITLFILPIFFVIFTPAFNMAVGSFLRALILFAFVLFLLLFLIISKRELGIKIRFGLFGMVLGVSFAIYSLLPVLTIWISSWFQDIAKLTSIPNLKAAIAEHNATSVLWFSVVPIILLYAFVVFIAWIFLHDGVSMADKLVSMAKSKSTDSRSGLQLAFEENSSSKVFSAFIFSIWTFCALSNVMGFYFSAAGLEYGFTGNNLLLGSNMIEIVKNNFRVFFSFISALSSKAVPVEFILRMFFLIYAIPLAAIFSVLILRWIAELRRVAVWRRANPAGEIKDIVNKICNSLGIRHPVLVISDEPVITGSIKSVFPIGIVFKVSKNTIEMLSKDELAGMIAHEMAHLKRHSLMYSSLDFLSEWTFFGKGFLAIVTNSKEAEFEADRFACNWLRSNGHDKKVLISALQKSVVANAMLGYLAPSNSIMAFSGGKITESSHDITFVERMKLCYELYFGDLVLSYVHPGIEERIKRIEGL